MFSLEFKIWLEGIEEYDPYRSLVERHGQYRAFAFNKWFENAEQGRIYIPFNGNVFAEEDAAVEKELRELFGNCEFIDLKKGYVKLNGSHNVYKIGKLLESLKFKELKEVKKKLDTGLLSQMKYEKETRSIASYYDELKSDFENLPSRVKGQFLVVISDNIHDIGSMSTGRGWTSCMNLIDGSHHEDVYKEIANGGFIAYLIRDDDKNITNPIARIHIRRFDRMNKGRSSIAIPEKTIYGKEVPGFYDTVKQWIDSKQGPITPGRYYRIGGEYSDTWSGQRKHLIGPEKTDSKKTIFWINKWLNLDKKSQSKHYQYILAAMQSFFQSEEKFPSKFLTKVKDFIFDDKSTIPTGSWNQSTGQFRAAFAVKYPEMIKRDDFDKAFNYAVSSQKEMLEKLLNSFPQYVDENLLKSIKDHRTKEKIVKINKNLSSEFRGQIEHEFMNNFNVENPTFSVSDRDKDDISIYKVLGNINDELQKLHQFNPIPEPLIRKVIEFVNNIDSLKLTTDLQKNSTNDLVKDAAIAEAESAKFDIIGYVIHAFSMTGSDTPTVQRFYQSLLPHWGDVGGIGILGHAIAGLKENGRQFLPFILQKKNELEKLEVPDRDKNRLKRCIETFDYVIDAVQNGTGHSNKYHFDYGISLDAVMANEERKKKKNNLRDAIIHRKKS